MFSAGVGVPTSPIGRKNNGLGFFPHDEISQRTVVSYYCINAL